MFWIQIQKCDKVPVTDKNTQKSKQEVKKEELINGASTKKRDIKRKPDKVDMGRVPTR